MNHKLITPLLALCCLPLSAKVYTVSSPDKNLVINVDVDNSIKWDIKKGGTVVLHPSAIALQTDRQILGLKTKVSKASVTNWKNDGKDYHKLLLACNGYDIEFRVFNDAAAYRFIPKKMINKVINETSEYRFAGDYQTSVPASTPRLISTSWISPRRTDWSISSSTRDGATQRTCSSSLTRWIWQASSTMPSRMA